MCEPNFEEGHFESELSQQSSSPIYCSMEPCKLLRWGKGSSVSGHPEVLLGSVVAQSWLCCLCISVLSRRRNDLLKPLENKITQNVFHTRNYAERLSFILYKPQLLLSSVHSTGQYFPHMVYRSGQRADRHIVRINSLPFTIIGNSYVVELALNLWPF